MNLAKRRDETDMQWRSRLARAKQEARDREQPLVPIEAQQHGDYEKGFVTHVETATKAHTMRNSGGDPVQRWRKAERLSATQIAAIDLCRALWKRAGTEQRITANYGERIPTSAHAIEHRAINEIEARQDLHRIRDYVPLPYWSVFENIARFCLPIGETCQAAGYTGTGAELRARTVVCFVADIIAMRERL